MIFSGTHCELVLVIVGNDCSGKMDDEELLKEYEDLIGIAVKKAASSKSVKVRSVCPRDDDITFLSTMIPTSEHVMVLSVHVYLVTMVYT